MLQVLKRSEGNNEKIQHTLKISEQKMQGLKMQVQGLQEEVRKQHQQLQRLEVEKESYNKEAMNTKHRCIEQVENHTVLSVTQLLPMCTVDGRGEEERDGTVPAEEENSRVREQTQAATCMRCIKSHRHDFQYSFIACVCVF